VCGFPRGARKNRTPTKRKYRSAAGKNADRVTPVIDRTYAVEGFGEAKPPRDLLFLVVLAGFAGKYH